MEDILIFNNDILEKHPLYKEYPSTLEAISIRDYRSSTFKDDIHCIDMDSVESNRRTDQEKKTVDAVIGINSVQSRNRFVNDRLLLIELRVRYKSESNLSQKDLEQKVSHSKDLLSSGPIQIDQHVIFIFSQDCKSRAVHKLNSFGRNSKELKDCIVCTVDGFSQIILSKEQYPPVPIHKAEDIIKSLPKYDSVSDFAKFQNRIEEWCKNALKYKHSKHNYSEYLNIKNVLNEYWKGFRTQYPTMKNDDLELEIECLEEDFPDLLVNKTDKKDQ